MKTISNPNKIKKGKTRREKKILKQNSYLDHQDSMSSEDEKQELDNDSKVQLNEDEKEGGEEENLESSEEKNLPDSKAPTTEQDKSNSNYLKANKADLSAILSRKSKGDDE